MLIILITLLSHQTNIIHARDGLSLYTEALPIEFYNEMQYNLFTFSINIPTFIDNKAKLQELKSSLKKIIDYKVEGGSTRSNGIVTTISDIVVLTEKTMGQLEEIEKYQNSECQGVNLTSASPCHIDFEEEDGNNKFIGFVDSILLHFEQLPENLTTAEVNSDPYEKFSTYYGHLKSIVEEVRTFSKETELIVEDMQSLSALKLSNSRFNLIKDSECLINNPYRDIVKVTYCEFCSDKATCEVLVKSVRNKMQFGQIQPIPYLGHELKLKNLYLNLTTKELVKIECAEKAARSNCKVTTNMNDTCIDALEVGYLSNIIEECEIVPSAIKTPKLTKLGVLIPADEFKIFVIENKDRTISNLNIFEINEPPAIVASTKKLIIIDQGFTYVFDKVSNIDKVYYTQYTEAELEDFQNMTESAVFITDELMFLLVTIAYGIAFMFLSGIGLFSCIKLYKKAKQLRNLQSRMPSRPYSKNLSKFLDGRLSQNRGDKQRS